MFNFKIIVFNVGQGDHILLEFPNGEFGIIDFFFDPSINFPQAPPAVEYLSQLYPDQKELIFAFIHISHFHDDHIKGLDKFIYWVEHNKNQKIKIKKFILPGNEDIFNILYNYASLVDQPEWDELISDIILNRIQSIFENIGKKVKNLYDFTKKHRIKIEPIQFNRENFTFKDPNNTNVSVLMSIGFAPDLDLLQQGTNLNFSKFIKTIIRAIVSEDKLSRIEGINRNTLSSILMLKFFKHTLFFGGDADLKSWLTSINSYNASSQPYGDLACLFIKASHHGSITSSSEEKWMAILDKSISSHIVFSAGPPFAETSFEHPHDRTLQHLSDLAEAGYPMNVLSTNGKGVVNWPEHKRLIPWSHTPQIVINEFKKNLSTLNTQGIKVISNAYAPDFVAFEFLVTKKKITDVALNKIANN